MPVVLLIFLLFLFIFPVRPAFAVTQWSLSIVDGFYYPRLYALNRVLTSKFVELGPRKTDARPVAYPVLYQGANPVMPEMEPKGPKFGLQVQADISPRYTVILGQSISVLESQSRDIHRFFVGFNIDSTRETRFSLTLNQLWLGVRRNFEIGEGTPVHPRHRLYGEVGIMGVTGATLTTNVWLHVFAPEEGFDFYKVASTVSEGRGYATYLGAGGEYFLNKRVSLGLDLEYVVGGVQDLRFTQYFTVDPLEADLIRPGDIVTVTDLDRGSKGPLFLTLDGWDIKGLLRFYF